MGQTYYTAKWFSFIHIYLFFFKFIYNGDKLEKKNVYNWITLLYTWNIGNSSILQSLKFFKKSVTGLQINWVFFVCFLYPQVEIPNIQKQRKHLAKLVLDMDSSRTRYGGFSLLPFLLLWKSSDPSWKAVACVCVCVYVYPLSVSYLCCELGAGLQGPCS